MNKFCTLLVVIVLVFSSCVNRIGDLTLISNRNIEFEKKHIELKRNVIGKNIGFSFLGIPITNPNMEMALDDCIKREGRGEYLKNAKIDLYWRTFILFSIHGVKVSGDLMGYEDQIVSNIKTNVIKTNELKIGDIVSFNLYAKKIVEGKLIGMSENIGIVEYTDAYGKMKKKEIPLGELTKIER